MQRLAFESVADVVVEHLGEGVQVIGFDWTYLYVNDSVVEHSGRSREELLGQTMMACYPGIETTPMFAELARCMETRRTGRMENEFPYPDGSRRWFALRFVPITPGVCVLSEDISERRRNEVELEQSARELRELFEAVPDGILLVAHDGAIRLANAEARRMFGADRVRSGEPVDAVLPLALQEAHKRHREAFVAAPQPRRMGDARDLRALREDGSEFSVDASIGPFSHAGQPASLCVIRDVSERRKLEDALRKTEEQLRQAQKLEAIGGLAGGIAHDFNNMLSVILSYGDLIAADLRPEDPMRADVLEIVRTGERAADLTRQLLAFARQQVLEPRALSLSEVANSMMTMLRRLIGAHIELNVLAPHKSSLVWVDRSQIEQVILNLAVNARDAMPKGGKLTIEVADVDLDGDYVASHFGTAPGPHVMLAVTDTGHGMDEATRARMFEPFFTTKERGKGTGLGLATVFGIVKQSGGNIWVYSEPGGTVFKIYFPRHAGSKIDLTPANGVLAPMARGTETILLVEDDESVRTVVRTILTKQGYHVLEASNGGEALLICEQHGATIHLLLTDVIMPRMSGPEVAERLRAIRPRMRVLFMSGYTDNSVVHHGVLDSGAAFLQKPVTPEPLARKVREVLDLPQPA